MEFSRRTLFDSVGDVCTLRGKLGLSIYLLNDPIEIFSETIDADATCRRFDQTQQDSGT